MTAAFVVGRAARESGRSRHGTEHARRPAPAWAWASASASTSASARASASRARRLFAAALASLALAGCAAPPLTPDAGGAAQWSGRFSVTASSADAPDERSSGRFLLHVLDGRSRLELSSPLGQTLAQLQLADGRARLTTAEGKQFEADSAEALTEQVFGWRVPIGDLPRWLDGRFSSPTEFDGPRAVAARENDWSIRVEAWRDDARPARLALSWPADAAAVDTAAVDAAAAGTAAARAAATGAGAANTAAIGAAQADAAASPPRAPATNGRRLSLRLVVDSATGGLATAGR